MDRTCWRVIDKLFTKIAYFMINERHLSILAPHILKVIGLSQAAMAKLSQKTNFSQLFLDVIDHVIT